MEEGKFAPREKLVRPVEVILIVCVIFLMVGQYVNFQQNNAIREVQDEGKVRGYINRAVTCDTNKAIGAPEPEGCMDPAIMPYRDPAIKEGTTASSRASQKTQKLICAVLIGSETPSVRQVYDELCAE